MKLTVIKIKLEHTPTRVEFFYLFQNKIKYKTRNNLSMYQDKTLESVLAEIISKKTTKKLLHDYFQTPKIIFIRFY